MRLRTLRSTALAGMAALAFGGCTEHHSHAATPQQATRWQGPGFPGGGVAGLAQSIAAGPPALSCGDPTQFSFTRGPAPGARSRLLCFYDRDTQPAATVEWIVETAVDAELVHVRLTLNPDFVDNTYGDTSIGWPPKGKAMAMAKAPQPMAAKPAHSFMDLVGSDHAELKLSDASGKLVLHFKQDYISPLASAPSGYASLGVLGGDGKMIAGDASDVVAVSTSLERNLNACRLSTFTVSSPATDASYAPVFGAEAWDYRVVYDVWVRAAAFGTAGFGSALVDFVHASPSKLDSPTSKVTERPCPPTWRRYCGKPEGCSDQCGDAPDEFCHDASVPPPPPPRAGSDAPTDAPL